MARDSTQNSPHKRQLIRRQQRVLAALEDAEAALKRFHARLPLEDSDDDLMERAFQETVLDKHKAIGAAIRAGLGDHPLVLPWVESLHGLGKRDLLRSTHTGL